VTFWEKILAYGFRWSWHFTWTGDTEWKADIPLILKYPTRGDFYSAVGPAFKAAAKDLGMNWLLIVAQASLESRFGNSQLSVNDNNYFGITAGSWLEKKKPVVNYPTHEQDPTGKTRIENRWFRKYGSIDECVEDWAHIIKTLYPKALEAAQRGDVQNYFGELKRGGYATDNQYVGLLLLHHDTVMREATV